MEQQMIIDAVDEMKSKLINNNTLLNNNTVLTTVSPIVYSPIIDINGMNIDGLPQNFKYGVLCPCCPKNEKCFIFKTKRAFRNHVESKKHKKWITDKNISIEIKILKKRNETLANANFTLKQRVVALGQQVGLYQTTIEAHQATIDLLTKQMSEMSQMRNNHYSELNQLHHQLTSTV